MAEPTPLASQRPSVVAGIGCQRDTGADEILALVEAALTAAGLEPSALIAIATLDRKADEPGLLAAAARLGVPLRTFAADQLARTDAKPSAALHLLGIPSVAEACALMAGPLLLHKQKSAHATCALAACAADFDLETFGQAVDSAPASTAAIAASRSLTSNAGP